MFMNKLEEAIKIAVEAHKNQKDKGGNVYILHPLRLMMQMQTEKLKIVAVLHDVVEDSDYTFKKLEEKGFSEEIIEALEALTKRESESYKDFILRVKKNKLASQVKIADLKDNSDLKRIKNPTKKDLERREKYKKAIKLLNSS